MATDNSPPPCGEVEARSASGGGQTLSSVPSVVSLARGWIGTPYVHQASLKGVGCDCLGLLRGLWREIHSDEAEDIPPYLPDWDVAGSETLREGLARHLNRRSISRRWRRAMCFCFAWWRAPRRVIAPFWPIKAAASA
jgi:NlpC/P60 family putative phage cell wall peptidase